MALRNGLLLALSFCVLGCGRGTPPTTGVEVPHSTTVVAPNSVVTATQAATEFVTAAKAGTASADTLTVDFKKVIGEPITPAEREKGYSDSAARDWLKVVGPRLKSAQVKPIRVENAVATFELETGLLRMVSVDSKWRVDWFHAGGPGDVVPISHDKSGKLFAVAAFLDPLFTNNFELCEATLTLDAKKSLAPALSGDARGYNRGTLRGKLKSILNGATSYTHLFTGMGEKVPVFLTGPTKKELLLTLSTSARPEIWVISGID